jgi:nicotinamide riboside kinase
MIRAESGWVLQTMGERRVPVSQGPAQQAQKDRAMSDVRGDRAPRIALSGSAGVGKSTLGIALAKRLGVAYFPEGMRGRIESGLDIRSLGHEELRSLIWELWQEQVAREDAALATGEGFVSDRSPVDYLAFWMNYGFVHDADESQRFADAVLARVPLYDRVILLPFACLPLAADGVRSSNPWIQMRFHSTLRGLLEEHVSAPRFVHLPELVDLNQRLAWCEDLVTRAGEYARREGR